MTEIIFFDETRTSRQGGAQRRVPICNTPKVYHRDTERTDGEAPWTVTSGVFEKFIRDRAAFRSVVDIQPIAVLLNYKNVWFKSFLIGGASLGAPPSERPNILFVFADYRGRQASAYAKLDGPETINDVVQTPNFDRIATEGVLFRNAFVNAPSSTPCRSALLSGQYFWRTGRGAILQGGVWDDKIPSWPLLLHDSDYHIGKIWKVWSPGTPVDAPYGKQR